MSSAVSGPCPLRGRRARYSAGAGASTSVLCDQAKEERAPPSALFRCPVPALEPRSVAGGDTRTSAPHVSAPAAVPSLPRAMFPVAATQRPPVVQTAAQRHHGKGLARPTAPLG